MRTITLLAAFLLTARCPAEEFLLVTDGRPEAEIRVAVGEGGEPLRFAGEELQRYVKAMSGAFLPIASVEVPDRPGEGARGWIDEPPAAGEPRAVVIAVDSRLWQAPGAAEPDPRNEDRYLLRVSERRIAIVGATPRAALFGTYDLLERLGCGWCVPGDDAVPRRPSLSLAPLGADASPAFRYRMMLDFPLMSAAQSVAIVDWIAKNRMNWVHPCANAKGEPNAWYERRDIVVPEIRKRGLHVIFGGHTMHTWLPPERSKEHPDWFALNDGERKPPTLCVRNADMTAELVQNLERFLARCPEVEVVDLWHPDGDVYCHCAACTRGLVPAAAGGRIPEGIPPDAVQSAYVISYLEFMNRVAAAISKSNPRVLVSPLIYGPADHAMPDGCPAPADNLLVGLAHISRDSYRPLAGEPASARNQRFLGNDLTWKARTKHHYIYEYYNSWVAPFIYPGAQVIARDLRLLEELGFQGASSDMYGYSPSNMYVAARCLWSPGTSWEAAVRDFHLRYYGKAGEEMAENWIGLEKDVHGKAGYQSGGALQEPSRRGPAGALFNEVRPRQIELLERLIGRTEDPVVKARLERALKPWKMWSAEARFWAFPPFGADGSRS